MIPSVSTLPRISAGELSADQGPRMHAVAGDKIDQGAVFFQTKSVPLLLLVQKIGHGTKVNWCDEWGFLGWHQILSF